MRRFFQPTSTLFVLFVAVWVLASCGGTVPSTSAHHSATSNSPTATPASPTLYVLNEVSVRAIKANDGTPLWSQSLPDKLNGYSMTIASGTAYVAESTSLHAFDAKTGKPQWTGTTSGGIDAMVFLDQTLVLTEGKSVYGYSSKDGSLLWRQDIPDDQSDLSYVSPSRHLFIENGLVYVWYGDALLAIKAQSGTVVWKQVFPSQNDDSQGGVILDVDATPDMLIVDARSFTSAYRAADGTQIWTVKTAEMADSQSLIYLVGKTVYIWNVGYQSSSNSELGTLSAVNLQDGTKQWSVTDTTATNANNTPPGAFSDSAFFLATGPTTGDLEVRSLQDGHVIWTKPGAGTYKTLVADGNVAYGYLDQQGIVATSADKQQQLWLVQNLGSNVEIVNHHPYTTFGLQDPLTTTPEFASIDPATGKALWTFTPSNGEAIGPPIQMILEQ